MWFQTEALVKLTLAVYIAMMFGLTAVLTSLYSVKNTALLACTCVTCSPSLMNLKQRLDIRGTMQILLTWNFITNSTRMSSRWRLQTCGCNTIHRFMVHLSGCCQFIAIFENVKFVCFVSAKNKKNAITWFSFGPSVIWNFVGAI